jgi:hypothetical protein
MTMVINKPDFELVRVSRKTIPCFFSLVKYVYLSSTSEDWAVVCPCGAIWYRDTQLEKPCVHDRNTTMMFEL